MPAAVLILAGCYPAGVKSSLLSFEAHKAMQAGEYQRCVDLQTQASAQLQALSAKYLPPRDHANVLAYSAAAQMGLADCLTKLGRKDEAGPPLKNCLDMSEQAVSRYALLPQPKDEIEQIGNHGGRFTVQTARAQCLKALGRLPEAIAAREEAIAGLSGLCGHRWTLGTKKLGESFCNTLADETEAVAKWKKELAGGKP